DNPNIGLCIIGDGPMNEELRELVRSLNIGNRVYFAGHRSSIEIIMGGFDCLVIPSLTEGLPITLLEAMKVGLPIIATDVGGIPYVIESGRTGVLVKPGSREALSLALSDVVSNKYDLSELSVNASKLYSDFYTSKFMADRYLEC